MKTVLSNNKLPHLWAHQTQPEGRNDKRSMTFLGESFYSYSAEIGRVIKRNGKTAYIINDTSYSITTQRHQSMMRRAIPGDAIVFHLGGIGHHGMPEGNKIGVQLFDYAILQSADCAAKATRARSQWKKDYLISSQAGWIEQAIKVSKFFGLRRKVNGRVVERYKDRILADDKRRAKEALELEARRQKENADRIQKWINGEKVMFPWSSQRVYLRAVLAIDCNGERHEMQTSRGACVPIADAERAFRFAIVRRTKDWHHNGEECKVGDHQLDAVNEHGIVAGCHRIDWEEIERFAKLQGWM